jgi:hypothetical protein
MEEGHVADVGHGVVLQSSWTRGMPIQRKFIGGISYNKKSNLPMTAYRCTRCGYVEFYAESG